MRPFLMRLLCAGLALAALAGCIRDEGTGFVQIKAAPVAASSQLSLYLDSVKLDPLAKGDAVLVQKAGTSKLQISGWGGQMSVLCEIVVKKNRITTVTVSMGQWSTRCQCSHTSQDPQAGRTCVS